jgi:hypothetical protein
LFCANNSIPKVFVKNKQQRLFKITAAWGSENTWF